MLKAVVDTNIFVSSLLSIKGRPAEILNLWRDALFILVTSPSIISEIKSVLQRPAIKKKYRISAELIDKLILLLEKDALLVPGLSNVSGAVPEDPSDEIFLSAALDAEAQFIVSGDRHLLDLGEFRGIPILTVQGFFELLKKEH
jgi:uncharacterized protein